MLKRLQRTVKSDCCPLDAQDLFHQRGVAERLLCFIFHVLKGGAEVDIYRHKEGGDLRFIETVPVRSPRLMESYHYPRLVGSYLSLSPISGIKSYMTMCTKHMP
jgi:hypothetical protein